MGLFGRAKALWDAKPTPASGGPQTYRVACPRGHRLEGHRTSSYQAIRCPECGEGIFVLPRSPLPDPVGPDGNTSAQPPARTSRRAAPADEGWDDPIALSDPAPLSPENGTQPAPADFSAAEAEFMAAAGVEPDEVDADIEWEAEPEPAAPAPRKAATPPPAQSPRARPSSPAQKPAAKSAPAPKARPAPAPAKPTRPKPSQPVPGKILVDEESPVGGWARRNRPALIFTGVLAVVLMTVGIQTWRRRLSTLPQVIESGRTLGLSKLDAGEFHVAKALLAEAASAVDLLGGTIEGADEIKQGAAEAAIFTDLVPETLERILEEAATFEPAAGWRNRFDTFYKGKSIIIDAPLASAPNPSKPGSTYELDYKVYFGKGPKPSGTASVNLDGFRLFERFQAKAGEQSPFGARLKSIDLNLKTGEWEIQLEPDSGVYMQHHAALQTIGWPGSDISEEPAQ